MAAILSEMLTFVNSALLTHSVSGLLFNGRVAETVYETRRRKLDILIAEHESIKAMGEAMRKALQHKDPDAGGKDYANTISQYKNGKPIGFQFARDLEESMGKPKNWMDNAFFEEAEFSVDAKEAAQIVMNMAHEGREEERQAAMQLLRAMNNRGKPSAGKPFPDVPKGGKKRKPGTQ